MLGLSPPAARVQYADNRRKHNPVANEGIDKSRRLLGCRASSSVKTNGYSGTRRGSDHRENSQSSRAEAEPQPTIRRPINREVPHHSTICTLSREVIYYPPAESESRTSLSSLERESQSYIRPSRQDPPVGNELIAARGVQGLETRDRVVVEDIEDLEVDAEIRPLAEIEVLADPEVPQVLSR